MQNQRMHLCGKSETSNTVGDNVQFEEGNPEIWSERRTFSKERDEADAQSNLF